MRGSVKFTLELFLIAKFRVLTVGLVHHTQTLDLLLTWYKVYLYIILYLYITGMQVIMTTGRQDKKQHKSIVA